MQQQEMTTAPVELLLPLCLRAVCWEKDLAPMLRIERKGFVRPWNEEKFRRFAASSQGRAVIAEINGQVAGYVLYQWCGCYWHVDHIVVDPSRQSQGLGRTLLRHVMKSEHPVTLNVRLSNTRAQSLYARLGFGVNRRLPAHYDDGETAVVMQYAPPAAPCCQV